MAMLHGMRDDERPIGMSAWEEELLALERVDARHLKKLERQVKNFRCTTVWSLVVEAMALDTQKHVRILEFLRGHARATERPGAPV